MKSKRATQLYYQFRQALTFKEIVNTFKVASDPYRYHMSNDWDGPPNTEGDREDICMVQEHYELILEEIFGSVEIDKSVMEDLQRLYASLAMKRSANFMKLVAQYIFEGLDYREAARNSFLVAKQISGASSYSITGDDIKDIFGTDPKFLDKKKKEIEEIEQYEKILNMTAEQIQEQRNIDNDDETYLEGLKAIYQDVKNMMENGSLIINK